jgi:hypothetical protein
VLFGIGVGFASSQLTNVILSDIDKEKAGVASGTNTTVRQVGAALGIAVIASLLNAQTIKHAVQSVRAIELPPGVKTATIAGLRGKGLNFAPPPGTPKQPAIALAHALEQSVVAGARPALLFAAAVVALGGFLSLLIPDIGPLAEPAEGTAETAISAFESIDLSPGAG